MSLGRVAVNHHHFRVQGKALQGTEVNGPHLLGSETGQAFHLFEGRAQVRVKPHFAEELPQLQDGVGGRRKPEDQHAGHADEIILGQAHGPAIDPGQGDPLADGHFLAEDLGGLPGLGRQVSGVFKEDGSKRLGPEAQGLFQLGGSRFIVHGHSLAD